MPPVQIPNASYNALAMLREARAGMEAAMTQPQRATTAALEAERIRQEPELRRKALEAEEARTQVMLAESMRKAQAFYQRQQGFEGFGERTGLPGFAPLSAAPPPFSVDGASTADPSVAQLWENLQSDRELTPVEQDELLTAFTPDGALARAIPPFTAQKTLPPVPDIQSRTPPPPDLLAQAAIMRQEAKRFMAAGMTKESEALTKQANAHVSAYAASPEGVAEKAFSKGKSESAIKGLTKSMEAAEAADEMLLGVHIIAEELKNNPHIGTTAGFRSLVGNLANEWGWELPEKFSLEGAISYDTIQKELNKMVLEFTKKMKGSLSNKELSFATKIVGEADTSKEALMKAQYALQFIADRAIESNDYLQALPDRQQRNLNQAKNTWRKRNPYKKAFDEGWKTYQENIIGKEDVPVTGTTDTGLAEISPTGQSYTQDQLNSMSPEQLQKLAEQYAQ